MSDETVEILSVGDGLRQEIENGPFDQFVVFSYGITPDYLDWFDADDKVVVCGPNKTVETVRETAAEADISEYNRQTHAKIYLLYNDSQIVAYLGSFNFTRNGLYGGVEWGARYEAELTESPDPEALITGRASTEISPSPVIEQILTIVGASMTGDDTGSADSWVANTGIGEGVVHTLQSNTLQSALSDMLWDVEGSVEISYYSPFVTYRGITEFTSHLPDNLDKSDIEFAVYTKRLDRIQDDESMLSPEEVEKLNERFGSFRLRVRAAGDQGNQLGDGREIRNGMAHLKAITLTDCSDEVPEPLGTLFTSANLSERAWDKSSDGFEIGVALENIPESRQAHRFFTQSLPRAYVDPQRRELEQAGGTGTPQTLGSETWLDTRLHERTKIKSDSIAVEWDPLLPSLESLAGTLRIRETSTGEREGHNLSFDQTEEGFTASFPSVAERQNWIIDFIRLEARSKHAPPELEYTAHELRKFRAEEGLEGADDPVPESWREYDEIIWNGSVRKPVSESSFGDVETVRSVQLRSRHETEESYYAIIEPDSQPHIDQLIESVETDTATVQPLGELLRVSVEMHSSVKPHPERIGFRSTQGETVDAVGFATAHDTVDYYLSPEFAGQTLAVEIEGLLERYVQHSTMEVNLPSVESDALINISSHVSTDPWEVIPENIHPILTKPQNPALAQFDSEASSPEGQISTDVSPRVEPPESLLEKVPEERLALWWRPSGMFQTGTVQSISASIPEQEARTRVSYRGVVEFDGEHGPVNVWLPGGDFVVKEQPFINDVDVSLAAVPKNQKIDNLRSESVLGWATIQQKDLLRFRASDLRPSIRGRLYANGKALPRRGLWILEEGGVLCFPVLGHHVGRRQRLTLRLWLETELGKAKTYSEVALDLELSVEDTDEGLEIALEDKSRQVNASAEGELVTLDHITDNVERGELETQTRSKNSDDIYEIKSYDPLRIEPHKMLLLHLTDR